MPIIALTPWDAVNEYLYAPAYEDYESGIIADEATAADVLIDADTNSFWESAGDGVSPLARILLGGLFQDDVLPEIPAGARVAWIGGEFDAWWGITSAASDPGPVSFRMKLGVDQVNPTYAVTVSQPLAATVTPAVLDQWVTYRLTPYVPPLGQTIVFASWVTVWVDIGTDYSPRPNDANGESAPGPFVRFSRLRGELMWVGRPTQSIIEPDATISTSRPTVAWEYVPGVDGGPQVAYRIAAGPASTTTGPGGWTSGPEIDTGIVYSSEAEAILPGTLANGVAYHIDLDVAQMVNGVLHWAGPVAVTTTATFAGPDNPIVTPVIVADDGYIALNIDLGGDRHADRIMIERSANGTDGWVEMITDNEVDIQALVPEASVLGFRDFETLGNGVPTWYRVKTYLIDGENHASSTWATVGPVEWSSPRVFLKAPGRPWLAEGFTLMEGSLRDIKTGQDAGVFEVKGRRFPVVHNAGRKGQTATLFVGITDDDAVTAEDAVEKRNRLGALLEEDPLVVQAPDEFGGWSNRTVHVGPVTERAPIPKIDQPQRVFALPVTELAPARKTAVIAEGPYLSWLPYWIVS